MSNHKDWEKIWFIVMLVLVTIFTGLSYFTIVNGSSATYRYGLPLASGVPKPLPNGTVVIYMAAIQWAFLPNNATEIIYLPNGTMENISVTSQVITYVHGYPYIKVYPNQPVLFILYSNNVVHGFYIRLPHGAQNVNIVPGINSYSFFFSPSTPGNYTFHCAEYCGIGHSYMYGYLWVM
ncbi:quinol oxidase subunit 2 [Sulfolobus sp. A20]|uniref:proton pump complex quinol oxidase subunit SoxA n=1 Tax=Saccharolobus sp. A20 TaxID=1891280 RepID=UPI000845E7F8|nr:proton pump complex quinol oxidase subunit SoxA [Sulfolobus sp. A20]TRM79612.1 quinol oxidase subunit 2 [Sulfolobus sp. B5]TRM80321.1 quinol oxidase subunit 2 [Sulfolobus sp. D5]TRM84068.1 quinol oxidase subunit 2 [Sulfolobus sp. F3]TRM87055.1 quinol oxidase subunit 2 [Sulfolobus sp. C3]TRM97978.1 quinol oxidase subunit 2 [Sulfolobus sp. E1]